MRRSNHGSRIQTSKIMLRYLRIISEINCDLDGVSLNQFVNNRIIHRATIMSVNLISEATNTLGDSFKRNNPQVNWYMIRLLRNELIHNYYATSKYFLWTFVKDTLPMIEKIAADYMIDRGMNRQEFINKQILVNYLPYLNQKLREREQIRTINDSRDEIEI